MSDTLLQLDATAAGALIRRREVSPVELTQAALERIARVDPAVSAFARVLPEEALAAARRAERELASDLDRGPLHGIPVAAKDLFDTAGTPTEGGSQAYAGRVPDNDAACVERLREAGAVLLGKTQTHELAYGVTTPATRNPWSLEHTAGGSSGGSGAAIAASECAIALGTDTGGSIRIPAACCGVAGLKPTYGRVSRHGVLPLSPSLDTAGPLGRSVRDLAVALSVLAGHDSRDPASLDVSVDDYLGGLDQGVAGLTLGFARGHFSSSLDPDVQAAVGDAAAILAGLGAAIHDVELPLAEYGAATAFAICLPEATAAHARVLAERPDALGEEVRTYLEVGALRPQAEHARALRVRATMRRAWRTAFAGLDAVIAPTLPVTAVPAEQHVAMLPDGEAPVVATYLRFCAAVNVTGLPALSLPCGFDRSGLPIGLQLIGRPLAEAMLLRIGRAYERATDWGDRRPSLPLTHRYGADSDQVADLYLPDGLGPSALAVVIHGGFWRARFGRELMHGVCCDLQERGIAAWNVEYRRLGTGGDWPAPLEDVRQAIAELPTLDESRIDLGRVALVGHSAGGHLALLAGAHGAYAGVTIAGVLALAAVSDLALADELGLGSGAVRELLADNLAALPEASPRALLPLGVRHLHVHGDADDRVPLTMTTAFVEAAGHEAAVTALPGVDHFGLIDPASAAWAVAVRQLAELLNAGCSRGA